MKILNKKPPIWEEAVRTFNLSEYDLKGTVFTYADCLYNPTETIITSDLMIHEETHQKQQQSDPTVANIWWRRYLEDPAFRLEQEVEAYANQYKFICNTRKDRNYQYKFLHEISKHLSSKMYGNIVIHSEAMKLIREKSAII